ncbi:hypothetical protein GP486_004616 [Trichoglossum hirsutum]|uniref:GPI inositol-deacylase n=1 Tax=Trichoglossum hirsutum TaxID=265104 RepID=A0A9P8RPE7_9PEZI|nr:hypothetical protein GP486_004616 [Trichoglossum hirsutum]
MLRKIGLNHHRSTGNAGDKELTDGRNHGSFLTSIPSRLRPRSADRGFVNVGSVPLGTESQSELHPGSYPDDTLGLHLVYDNSSPSGDIVFVHGLGGTATRTWCWNRDLENFWPIWLPDEEGLSSYRIFTFGYNSNFRGSDTKLSLTDFAKELLLQMLTFSGGPEDSEIPIGHRPIIFVAHSMGGLVVKKACVLGRYDREFASIISQVYGIIFLSTPHRGAQYAKILNNVLSIAPIGAPPKAYIADLETLSSALQDINEQFRTICGGVALVSFFETLKTSCGVAKMIIVEKDSGVLGYPQETSSPLHADHHNVCKFKSREDRNYITVRNVLKLWASRIHPACAQITLVDFLGLKPSNFYNANNPLVLSSNPNRPVSSVDLTKEIESVLGIHEPAEDDFNTIRSSVTEGTCAWLTRKPEFMNWVRGGGGPVNPATFWLIGLPATGKSTLASAIIDHLQSRGEDCQYHFFSSGHQAKRTTTYGLRSIASQLAKTNPEFRERLLGLHKESRIAFNSQNQSFNVIWERIFEGIIFKMKFQKPLFWALDAIDEVDSGSLLVNHLLKIQSSTPIKLFLTSRPMKMPSSVTYNSYLTTFFLSKDDTDNDIRAYVEEAARDALPDDQQVQEDVINQVLEKASGSFLWVKLALEMLQDNWHTQDDIRKVLTEVPRGMEPLYIRMLDAIKAQPPRQQLMAKRILTWATCSWRPLTIAELQVALEPEFKGFVRLEDTIVQICGHFISMDNSKISIIHLTARHFLLRDTDSTPAFINLRHGHEHAASVCLKHLSNDSWRRIFKAVGIQGEARNTKSRMNRLPSEQDHPFLGYATCYWAYHVSKSPLDSQDLEGTLKNFFARHCLTWIEAVALSGDLRHLTGSAKYLKSYAKRLRRSPFDAPGPPVSLKAPPVDHAENIQLWAIDFIRVVGKFGPNLVQNPSSVYRLIPPFCPQDSMIGKTYSAANERMISVTGLPSEVWGDCLTNVSVGDETASRVLATDAYFIVVIRSGGTIVMWHAETCEQARRMYHNEYIAAMALNNPQTLLATAGIHTYRVWDISSGQELYRLPKTAASLTMAISFGSNESELVVGLDDCSVTCFDLEASRPIWYFMAQSLPDDIQGCPRLVAFSPNLKRVAMAWRGKPPLVWDMTSPRPQHPRRCRVRDNTDALCAPEQMVWQTDGNSILILSQNTKIAEWHLNDSEQVEFDHVKARNMTISQDGNLLLTSDHLGTISVWAFPRLNLIYRLISENDFVRDLAFSPDNQRIYDTRGSICNVWEPDALVRPDESDLGDQSSIGGTSIATEPIISLHGESRQTEITALAPDSGGKYYCCGREDGTVMIHDVIEGKMIRKVYSHSSTSSVIAIAWSPSGKYMASGDDSGRIIAKRLKVKGPGKWGVFPVFDIRLDESVQQFLFNDSENSLLVSTPSSDRMWNLEAKKEVCSRRWGMRQSRRWVGHPLKPELLIWIDPTESRTYYWAELRQNGTDEGSESGPITPINTSCHSVPDILVPPDEHSRLVQWIALASKNRFLVYETLPNTGHNSTRSSAGLHLEFVSTSELRTEHPHSLTSKCMTGLTGRVERLLGTYQDSIVFLDRDYWLCTWEIDTDINDVKRHFFLPRDWINTEALRIAALGAQGTFFCPKHGRMAVVRNGMIF